MSYRYGRGSMCITSNRGIADWAEMLAGDEVITAAILDRLLHASCVLSVKGRSYRLRDLEDTLRRAKVIEDNGPADAVRVGSVVTVVEEGYDEPETYRIVGGHEADPTNGKISNESPFGRALLGRRVNQTVSVETPSGELMLRIKAIE